MSMQTVSVDKIDNELKRELLRRYEMTRYLPPLLVRGVLLEGDIANSNQWGLLSNDLIDFVNSTNERLSRDELVQHRGDHSNYIRDVIGSVRGLEKVGKHVHFESVISHPDISYQMLLGNLPYVSCQLHSDDVVCANCLFNTQMKIQEKSELIRKGMYHSMQNGVLTHLCSNSWHVVKSPSLIEISSVVLPAYSIAKGYVVGVVEQDE